MSNMTRQEYMKFQKETVEKSRSIYQKALEFCPTLFTPEIYPGFLNFLAKWNHFSAIDVVLLYLQYPNASFLAGYQIWQSLALEQGYDEKHMIINQDQRKKGITLLIPFSFSFAEGGTRQQNEQRYLTYKSILVFDISQIHELKAPPTFYPYTPIFNLEFPVFLSLCRRQFQKELSFAQGNPEDPNFKYTKAYTKGTSIFFLGAAPDKEKILSIFKEIVRFYAYKICKDDTERELVILSSIYALLNYYKVPVNNIIFSSIAQYQKLPPEKLFHIIHYICSLTQYLIYEFYKSYSYFIFTYSDGESNHILNTYDENKKCPPWKNSFGFPYLNFNEINIVIQNITSPEKEKFLNKLQYLKKYTKDAILLQAIRTLTEKILDCSDKQFQCLFQDVKQNNISTTNAYLLIGK